MVFPIFIITWKDITIKIMLMMIITILNIHTISLLR